MTAKLAHHRPERGVALVEAAIALPIVFLLLIGVLYISQQMQAHAFVTNIAQEGARYLAKQRNLEAGSKTSSRADTTASASYTTTGSHTAAHLYMNRLISTFADKDASFRINTINITSQYDDDPLSSGQDSVSVTIQAEVTPIGGFSDTVLAPIGLSNLGVSSTNTQPYLYSSTGSP